MLLVGDIFAVPMIPIVVIGALAGRRLFSILPQKVFDPLVLALAGIAALRLVGVRFFFLSAGGSWTTRRFRGTINGHRGGSEFPSP